MRHDDAVYAGTMLDLALKIRGRVEHLTRDGFDADENLRLAITHLIQLIGEAASRTSPGFRAAHPPVPWTQVIGMRNRIVHNYDDVNDDIIWHVATADLAPLVSALAPIVAP